MNLKINILLTVLCLIAFWGFLGSFWLIMNIDIDLENNTPFTKRFFVSASVSLYVVIGCFGAIACFVYFKMRLEIIITILSMGLYQRLTYLSTRMDSFPLLCIKYLLFFFNLLFAMTGIAILVVGSLLQGVYQHYSTFVNENFYLFPIFIIGAGGVIFMVAFFGCCGIARENLCMISTFASLLITLFILEALVGVGAYLYQNDLRLMITSRMDLSLKHYKTDTEVAKSWDILQTDLQCCGVNGTNDWKDSIPQSCCPELKQDEACAKNDASENGCLDTMYSFVEENAVFLIIIAGVVGCVQLVGICFACCVAHSIHKCYETV